MAKFIEAYKIGKVNEGGYANIKGDAGGETYAGIARNYWPKWAGWKIIDDFKKTKSIKRGDFIPVPALEELIQGFYKENFWDKMSGDEIKDQQVANLIYDWSLTSGKALRRIQSSIGFKGGDIDGVFGSKTIKKINTYPGEDLFDRIKDNRKHYYLMIGAGDNAKFLKGWLNRVDSFDYKTKAKK